MQLRRWLGLSGSVGAGLFGVAAVLLGFGRAPVAQAASPLPPLLSEATTATALLAGRVTEAQGGQPVSQVHVAAYDAVSLAQLGSTQTDPSGFYTLTVDSAYGAVKLQFTSELRYPTVWYLDQNVLAEATPITLTAPTIAALNIALQKAGTLSLTVTLGGAPLAPADFVQIQVFDAAGNYVGDLTRTGSSFYLGLRPGGYRLRYSGTSAVPGWQGGAATFTDTVPLTVTAGATNTVAVDLPRGGVITGRVTDALSGQPISLTTVEVFDADGFWQETPSYAYSAVNGVYTVGGLATGGYRLRFAEDGHATEYFQNRASLGAADVITAVAGQTHSGVDVALDPLGVITGALTLNGAPITTPGAVQITAYRPGTQDEVGRALNGLGGRYVLAVPSGTVALRFSGPGYTPEWYNNQPLPAVAAAVTASAGLTHTNINADLAPATGCLGGTLSTPTGTVEGAYAIVYDDLGNRAGLASSLPNGGYTLCGLAAGQYTVQFGLYPYAIEWHSDQPNRAAADAVVVQAAQTTTVNAIFNTIGGCLTGDVRGPAGVGEPPGRRQVQVLSSSGEPQAFYSLVVHALERTYIPDADGLFALCGLPPGTYTLVAWDDHDLNGRLGGDERLAVSGATLTAEQPIAARRLVLPAPRTFVPFMVR